MEKVAAISIIYQEPYWTETERCLDRCGIPLFFVDRHGVGSLAKAINSGFDRWGQGFEYIWFVTNVTFSRTCLKNLVEQMDLTGFAAITPAFNSDHSFCQPIEGCEETREVPYIEFTAPIVRSSIFNDMRLDEDMPYWGHDLDWGFRAREIGCKLGVFHGETLGHTYIRHTAKIHHTTAKRARLRKITNAPTRDALIHKYGTGWRKVLSYES